MDNLNCLKTLTEDIIKKQNDSLESINNLYRKVDKVSSDLSSLMNSLQMVGNRQFAENRVQDDDSAGGQLLLQQKDISKTSACDTQVPVSRELRLSSILLKAMQLVASDDEDDNNDDTLIAPSRPKLEEETKQIDQNQSNNSPEVAQSKQPLQHLPPPPLPSPLPVLLPPPQPPPSTTLQKLHHLPQSNPTKLGNNPVSFGQSESGVSQHGETKLEQNVVPSLREEPTLSAKPMDPDRIANILKRYSLYDDVEDDEESE